MATVDTAAASRPRHSKADTSATETTEGSDSSPSLSRWWLDGRLAAAVTWLVGTGFAFLIVGVAKLDPISVRGAIMPVSVGLVVFAGLLGVLWRTWRRAADLMLGVVVGAYAAWIALLAKSALYGTAMGYGGLVGDAVRIVAQATKYTYSVGSTDLLLPGVPSDYPPLYTWLTGRVAQVAGVPAWQLIQNTQVIWLSGTVVAVFLLWRHVLAAPLAAVLAMVAFLSSVNPIKPYEVIALAVMVPWIIATFGNPPRGRLHWLPAGLVGGLIFLTYQGYLVFMALGIGGIVWLTWRHSDERRRYLLHLGVVAAIAFVVSAWYAVPYLFATATSESSFGSDTYQTAILASEPLPLHFLNATPSGVLQLIGLVGLIAFFRSSWWARPMALLLVGTYVFFALAALRFALTGHTMFYQYAHGPIVALLVAAGVLTVAEVPRLIGGPSERQAAVSQTARRAIAVLAVALVAWSSVAVWRAWTPSLVTGQYYPRVSVDGGKPADLAHQETPPDLRATRFGPKDVDPDAVPIDQIKAAVEARRGVGVRPMALTVDERLLSYLPWYEYVAWSTTASPALARWDDRNAVILAMEAEPDPEAFAKLVADNAFGPIDVFVLRLATGPDGEATGDLQWRPDVRFQPAQFSLAHFDRIDLPNNYVLFVRKV